MKTIFIINPKAGTGKNLDKRKDEITKMAAELGVEVGFYITKAVGDAEKFAFKVFDYLWSDVAKLDRGIFFNPY